MSSAMAGEWAIVAAGVGGSAVSAFPAWLSYKSTQAARKADADAAAAELQLTMRERAIERQLDVLDAAAPLISAPQGVSSATWRAANEQLVRCLQRVVVSDPAMATIATGWINAIGSDVGDHASQAELFRAAMRGVPPT
jgi:type II secretory pathway pseudopilin PulG